MAIISAERDTWISLYELIDTQTGVSVGGRDLRYEMLPGDMNVIKDLMREEVTNKIRRCETIMHHNEEEFKSWIR